MKFLVDSCAGARLAEWLSSRGHDVLRADDIRPDPGDRVLLERAAFEGRVLVTIDTDFGRLIYSEGISHAGLVRLPDVPAEQRLSLMEHIFDRYATELGAHAIITVRGSRVRITLSASR